MITLIVMAVLIVGTLYYFIDLKGENISPLIRAVKHNQISFHYKYHGGYEYGCNTFESDRIYIAYGTHETKIFYILDHKGLREFPAKKYQIRQVARMLLNRERQKEQLKNRQKVLEVKKYLDSL